MPRVTWAQTSFSGGEWSPLAYGRVDLEGYRKSLGLCSNYMPTQQGGLTRRPGSRFVAAAKGYPAASSAFLNVRLERFEFNIEQAYTLEFGAGYIRFFLSNPDPGQLVVSGVAAYDAGTTYSVADLVSSAGVNYYCIAATTGNAPPNATYWYPLEGVIYEVPTSYTADEIFQLSFCQSTDTLYIAHANHPPAKLQRFGATDWKLTDIDFLDGPYQSLNATTTTLTPSGTSGTIAVEASTTNGINGGAGFRSQDVGRSIRIRYDGGTVTETFSVGSITLLPSSGNVPSAWLWGTIASVTDSTHITVAVVPTPASTLPSPAAASANVSDGVVTDIFVTDAGSGYKNQPVVVSVFPHSSDAAVITATKSIFGIITGLTLVSGGSGYAASTKPSLQFSGGSGFGAAGYATVDASGAVTTVALTATGFGYSGTVSVFVKGGPSGAGADATAKAHIGDDGTIDSIEVTNGGSGYTGGADVYISPPTPLKVKPTLFWRMGAWNEVDGYPAAVAFHQDRLFFAGTPSEPGRVDASNVGDYENFAPTEYDGTVIDSNALSFTVNASTSNQVYWMASDEFGMLMGTSGNEWVVTPSSTQQALTPTNLNARTVSNYGSVQQSAFRIGKATIFVQRNGRKLRELFYQFTFNTYQIRDLSLAAEHLTKGGIRQVAYQSAPQQIMWIVRTDGSLVGVTYDKDEDICGWHQHPLGGAFTSGASPFVASVACIPNPAGLRDDVWLLVGRHINGEYLYSIEVLAKPWEDGDEVAAGVFLDASAAYSGSPSATISGLDWLKGETVGVLADGSVHPDCVVDGTGAITLDREASKVIVGFRYTSEAQTLRIEAGGGDGPAQGKIKRLFNVVLRFFQSGGLELHSDDPNVSGYFYPLSFRTSDDAMDEPVPLFDGDKSSEYEGDWSPEGQVSFRTSDPTPSNITLLTAHLQTEDN